MKKILYLFMAILLSSCHMWYVPQSYSSSGEAIDLNEKLKSGNYILNEISCFCDSKTALKEIAIDKFKFILKDEPYYINNVINPLANPELSNIEKKDYLATIKSNPSKDYLTGYNYFIDITIENIKDEIETQFGEENSVTVSIEIYNLNTRKTIYFQKVNAVTSIEDAKTEEEMKWWQSNIYLSSSDMAAKALRKTFRQIERMNNN